MSASRVRPPRGQALFAVSTVVVLAAALLWLDRIGPLTPRSLGPGTAPSGAWICPHGGASDLTISLYLANPGEEPVAVRVTGLGSQAPEPPERHEVPPGTTLRLELLPEDRGAATYVEHFGGWIAAGWVAFTGEGVAAEPCAPEAAHRWYLPDGTTGPGEEANVVVANPFAGPAVIDVVLYSTDQAPVRHTEWTDLVVPARRSIVLPLNVRLQGEPVVATVLDVKVGRVAAATLGVSGGTHLRSTIGWSRPAEGAILPMMRGSGQTELIVLSTRDRSIRFGATALTVEQPRPAGGLTEQDHGPAVARAYATPMDAGPSAIRLFTLDGAAVVAALRALGPGEDPGATAGAVEPSESWVLLPAVSRPSSSPGAVLVNDGDEEVTATVELLPQEGGTAAAPVTVRVPAHGTAAVPPEVWASSPGSALLVRADGAIVALAASTSETDGGDHAFALGVGVPLPPVT